MQIKVNLQMNNQESWHIHVPTLFFYIYFLNNAYSEWMKRFLQYNLYVVQYVTPTFQFFFYCETTKYCDFF